MDTSESPGLVGEYQNQQECCLFLQDLCLRCFKKIDACENKMLEVLLGNFIISVAGLRRYCLIPEVVESIFKLVCVGGILKGFFVYV